MAIKTGESRPYRVVDFRKSGAKTAVNLNLDLYDGMEFGVLDLTTKNPATPEALRIRHDPDGLGMHVEYFLAGKYQPVVTLKNGSNLTHIAEEVVDDPITDTKLD